MREGPPVAPSYLAATRPHRSAEAIQMGSPSRRRALDQRQTIGQEDRHRRSRRLPVALARLPVDQMPAFTGAVQRPQQPAWIAVSANIGLDSSHALAEGNRLSLVASAARVAGERQADRLQEVRLAGPIRPPQEGQPIAQLDLLCSQIAKPDHPEASDAHNSAGSLACGCQGAGGDRSSGLAGRGGFGLRRGGRHLRSYRDFVASAGVGHRYTLSRIGITR